MPSVLRSGPQSGSTGSGCGPTTSPAMATGLLLITTSTITFRGRFFPCPHVPVFKIRPSSPSPTRGASEYADAALAFEVTLDRQATGPVTVDYATADGTATAGDDYDAASGTLELAAGETSKTIEVTVHADTENEGEETLTLRLTNAVGARIADGDATGTIQDHDPLPKEWLARLGRTVAGQVVDAVGTRLESKPGTHVRVGGVSLESSAAPEALRDD